MGAKCRPAIAGRLFGKFSWSVALVGLRECLTEARGKRGRLACGLEMRQVAKARHAEHRVALLTLLGREDRDRAGERDAEVPRKHGRAVHQPREQHTLHAEVAKEDQIVLTGVLGTVIRAVAGVAVAREERVKFGDDLL